jgi:hypothetical protein
VRFLPCSSVRDDIHVRGGFAGAQRPYTAPFIRVGPFCDVAEFMHADACAVERAGGGEDEKKELEHYLLGLPESSRYPSYIYMEFQWAFSCQVPSRNTAGNAFSCRKLRMALKRPETACPGTENVGDFDGRPGHGCRYRHMTRTLHQPITCAKAKTAATAAPAASFSPV